MLDRESSGSGSGSGSVPAADRCWAYQLPACFQQPAAPESRTAAGPLPLPCSLRPGADVRHRPPPARSTNSQLLARRAPDGLPDAPVQCGKAIPASAGSTGMMNPLSCPYPLFPHRDGAVPWCSRLSEFPKRIWKAAGSCQRCRAPAAFPGCVILVGILGMDHFIAWMRTCSAPAAPVALPDSSPRAGKERERA